MNTFFGALLLVALLVVISAFPIKGNFQIKIVESGSMEPNIHTGSIVVIKPEAKYAVGDIITFDANFRGPDGKKVPVTHRIVEIAGENGLYTYTTKGDANEENDPTAVRHQSVLGKVMFSVPYIGYAIETAKKPYGFLALVLIPSLIIISDQAKNIWDEIKKRKQNNSEENA